MPTKKSDIAALGELNSINILVVGQVQPEET